MSELDIIYTFPVRGHSFLPAGRILEREIKNVDTILLPEEYHDILRKHVNLHVYREDWQSFVFKAATAALC